VGAWLVFHDKPVLLGTAFPAYAFRLRHAVDADRIAASDNVTRRLIQEGAQTVSVGFLFSLGRSTARPATGPVSHSVPVGSSFVSASLERLAGTGRSVSGMKT